MGGGHAPLLQVSLVIVLGLELILKHSSMIIFKTHSINSVTVTLPFTKSSNLQTLAYTGVEHVLTLTLVRLSLKSPGRPNINPIKLDYKLTAYIASYGE